MSEDKTIVDGALQINLICGTTLNVCVFKDIEQLVLNLQKNKNAEDDEQLFLTIEQTLDLINELKSGIKQLLESHRT